MDLPDYLSHLDITPAPDFVAGIDTFYDILSTANSRTRSPWAMSSMTTKLSILCDFSISN